MDALWPRMVKCQIQDYTQLSPDYQQLIHQGRLVSDDQVMNTYGVSGGDNLTVVLWGRGVMQAGAHTLSLISPSRLGENYGNGEMLESHTSQAGV